MKRNPHFELMDVAGEFMAIPVGKEAATFGGIVALNEEAFFLLNQFSEPMSIDALIDVLVNEYDVDESTAREDINMFIQKMVGFGIIEM